jgi:hypothetical protein
MENQTPNQGNINQQFAQQFGQQPLPNSTAVLVLGIISIPVCFCYFLFGIPGLATSIISLVLATRAMKQYNENPGMYSEASYNNMKGGRVCAIIGLILNAICLLIMVIYVIFAVSLLGNVFENMPFK